MVRVGDDVARQLVLRAEVLVAGGTVAAHAHHLVAQREKELVVGPQVTGFGGAAGSTVLELEIEHVLLPCEVAQHDDVSVLVRTLEVGYLSSLL